MRIILSPAKQMKENSDYINAISRPVYMEKAEIISRCLKNKDYDELKALWKCNDKIAQQNFNRLSDMDLKKGLTPAVIAYDGIAFKYMSPAIFENNEFDYIQDNLRILSGLYGVLKPMDGVVPYRLEMQSKLKVDNCKDLYEYWNEYIYKEVRDDSGIIINLASKEYSKCVEKYVKKEDRFITITFCEMVNEKLVTKGTYAKMARGEMVKYMAENDISDINDMKNFGGLGYKFREDISSEKEFIFERNSDKSNFIQQCSEKRSQNNDDGSYYDIAGNLYDADGYVICTKG